ncbi:LOW QUALITY PROTEIN: kinesin-like protein KIFC3 [Menidia menidia]
MWVLCTLAVLVLHGLLRKRSGGPGGGESRRAVQPVQRSSALLGPVAMFSTRKTWDIGHAPCLEPWKRDLSLDASSLDFLMSDEDEGSFLSLPPVPFSQRPPVTTELPPNAPSQQLLIQRVTWSCWWTPAHTLQNKVCEFQTRLRSEEAARHLLVQQLQQAGGGLPPPRRATPPGETPPPGADRTRPEEEQLVSRLRTQVEELEEKLVDQTQEVERLRSELGATDLEKQLELLLQENQRLKQELKSCRSPEKLDAAAGSPPGQEAQARLEAQQREERRPAEQPARQVPAPARVKVVTQTLQAESADAHRALGDLQQQNGALQQQNGALQQQNGALQQQNGALREQNGALREQLGAQRQLLRELEAQLHESQRSCTQLRTQVLVYEGEMERTQGQLEAEMQNLEEEKNRVIEEAFVRAESEMKAVHENLAGVRMNLLSLQPALRTLTSDYNSLKRQVQDFPFMLDKAICEAKQEICQVISEVSSSNQELLRKYKREMNLRKKCHDELVRLRGNIRVFCRVRPVGSEEQSPADTRALLSFDPEDDGVLYVCNRGKVMTFELDRVFPPQASQEEVFQEVQSLVTSCIDGFNVCIFAYGQTGSGKTYTMEGPPADPGINQRALRLLFSEVSDKEPDWEYRIRASMVEIYNETLRDLLSENPTERLDIKMKPDGSGGLYVPGLTEREVETQEDINRLFLLGGSNRSTASTNLNDLSSRSHALLIVSVCGCNAATGSRTQGRLNLVDLAGSERVGKSGAEGGRLKEAQAINRSLAALGDVINALRGRHAHVPFRNSRLTYLLQDSLSGDSKTLMVVQVSPLLGNLSESLCSLKFAQRVRSVELSGTMATRRNDSASSSPTHSLEMDSPPASPAPPPFSRASSAGSSRSSASRTPSSRRRSQSQLSTGLSGGGGSRLSVCPPPSSVSSLCGLIGWFADTQVDRAGPLVGPAGQDD